MNKDKFTKCMSIIYGELIGKNIDNELFIKFINGKNIVLYNYINIDDYTKYIDSIKNIPKMEIVNKKKKIFGLFRGK